MRRWMREGGRERGREAGRRQVAWTRQVDSSERWKRANDRFGEDVLLVNSQREEEMRGRRWSTSWLRNDSKSRYQCEKRADGLLFG